MLQFWCYPRVTLDRLEEIFPYITFAHVVELSLVYNPISESKNYYDCMTLFYHSCRVKQSHSLTYLPMNDLPTEDHIHSVSWICYKFGGDDILNKIEVQEVISNFLSFVH